MSRSGYSDDLDPLDLGRWRAQVKSAMRGQRGQQFFRDLVEALDAMPDKRLITSDLVDDSGCMCTLGVMARHKGVDPDSLDTYDYDQLGKTFNIAHQLAQEVMFENDEHHRHASPEWRWQCMRDWAAAQVQEPAQRTGERDASI